MHQVYDPIADKWEVKAELPLGVAWAMPTVYEGKIYLFGGAYNKPLQGITSTDAANVYDPETDRWKRIPKLPEPRMNGFAVTVGKFIYIALGYDREGPGMRDVVQEYRSTYRFDPATLTYTRMADSPVRGAYIASGPYKEKVYAVPGCYHERGFHQEYVWADGALMYDPAANRWTTINAPRIKKRIDHLIQCSSSAVWDGKLWVVGGRDEHLERTVMTDYLDLEKGVFVRGPDIPFGRCCGGGGIVNGVLAIMGGFVDGAGLGTPALPTWTLDTNELK